uniref:Uncharacterized protein n=1 Tax=Glossina palpalis gambiensis TaxID=67801 RepID=A0A1B0AZ52_9MUSC
MFTCYRVAAHKQLFLNRPNAAASIQQLHATNHDRTSQSFAQLTHDTVGAMSLHSIILSMNIMQRHACNNLLSNQMKVEERHTRDISLGGACPILLARDSP